MRPAKFKKNCHAMLSWTKVLESLNVLSADGSELPDTLPSTVACPACRQPTLTVMQDSTNCGVWQHCSSCGRGGDLVELASRVWRIDHSAALRRIVSQQGLAANEAVKGARQHAYLRELDRRRDLLQLWDEAARTSTESPRAATGALANMGLEAWLPPSRESWQCLSPHFGIMGRLQLMKYAVASQYRDHSWSHAVVVPAHDLPGRLGGMWVFPRSNTAKPMFARVTDSQGDCVSGWQPAGSRAIVLVDSAPLWWLLVMKHYQTDLTPPDWALWKGGANCHDVWQGYPGRRVVFWASELNGAVLSAAARLDAHIALAGNEAVMRTAAVSTPAEALQDRVTQQAGHWAAVAAEYVDRRLRTADAVASWAARENLSDELLHRIGACRDGLPGKLIGAAISRVPSRSVVAGRRRIVEQDGHWMLLNRGGAASESLSDTIVRLDEVLLQKSTGEVWYRGRLLQNAREYKFQAKQSEVTRSESRWMTRIALTLGASLPKLKPRCDELLQMAMHSFSSPLTREAPARLGWDPARVAYICPRFEVTQAGPRPIFENGIRWAGKGTAAGEILCDVPAEAGQLTGLTSAFWRVAGAVLETASAKTRHADPQAVVVAGQRHTRAAAESMGCLCQSAMAKPEEDWPTFQSVSKMSAASLAMLEPKSLSVICPTDASYRLWLELHEGLLTVDDPSACRNDYGELRQASRVLPTFMHWLIGSPGRHHLPFRELLGLWHKPAGEAYDVRPADQGRAFISLLILLYARGHLEYCDAGYVDKRVRRRLLSRFKYGRQTGLGVELHAVDEMLAAAKLPPVEYDAARESLIRSGVWLADVPEINGWLLDEQAWVSRLGETKTHLKIRGA